MKFAAGSTQVRVAPPSRERLLRLAEAGARDPIDGPEAWSDERTKQADSQSYPVLVARSTRTDLHKIARPHDD